MSALWDGKRSSLKKRNDLKPADIYTIVQRSIYDAAAQRTRLLQGE
jgi:hypothetical protein